MVGGVLLSLVLSATLAISAPGVASAAGVPALCTGVSAGQVSAVVGYTVPAATGSSSTTTTKAWGSSTGTECTYGQPTSIASFTQVVTLSYVTFGKAPTKAQVQAYVKAEITRALQRLNPTLNFTYAFSTQLGVPTIYFAWTGTVPVLGKFTVEFAAGWKGNKAAMGGTWASLPKSKVYGLEDLALKNLGL
jgi:hypothetical protein